MESPFDLDKFVIDVFDPAPGERVAVMTDLPGAGAPDNEAWAARRTMAERWREGIGALGRRIGFETLPLCTYPATGRHGADFPESGRAGTSEIRLVDLLDRVSLVLAMTEYSVTAALVDVCKRRPGAHVFRAASMPGVEPGMEGTSLAADYAEVARRCRILKEAFADAERVEARFSTGHRCTFDVRWRTCETDDGYLHRDKTDDVPVINLPSGETFTVPYEGERPGEPSRTRGELPVAEAGETVVFRVEANAIAEVIGNGPAAVRYRSFFSDDPARCNVAEVAFGCNDRAVVTGVVLEDEKAGFHWAYGRSDHLGGVTGLDRFREPSTVVHQDIVYALGSPIEVARAEIVKRDGSRVVVIDGGTYALW